MNPPADAVQVLSAMITPAVLISASGTLVFSTSSRLSRVVDRVRVLADQLEEAASGASDASLPPEKRDLVADQLDRLSRRALLLRSAMTSFYLGIGLFVATSLAVALVALAAWRLAWAPVLLGISGSCALLWGSLLLVTEGRLAVATTLQEMRYVREGVERLRRG